MGYIFSLSISFFCQLIYFNWKLITLQYCSGFCRAFTLVSHGCTCVPILKPPTTSLPIPQGHPSAPALSTLSHASSIVMGFAIRRHESTTCILKFYLYNVTFLTLFHKVVRQKGISFRDLRTAWRTVGPLWTWTIVRAFSCLLVTDKATEDLPASPAKARERPAPSGATAVSQAIPEREKWLWIGQLPPSGCLKHNNEEHGYL